MPLNLSIDTLKREATVFAVEESKHDEPSLYGVTDGKAIGTYLEQKFQEYLRQKYVYVYGSSAKGIDFPELEVDLKTTSYRQPQSSCPFRSVEQKIYGLGYHLLVFVYEKTDDLKRQTGKLSIRHTVFVERSKTADHQTTKGIQDLIKNDANIDDICAYLEERMLPGDEVVRRALAEEILKNPPELGYLTMSNALQWRLQYSRVIQKAGTVEGIEKL